MGAIRNPMNMNDKMLIDNVAPANGSTWAFGGVPMGSAGMPQRGNNMATFAQSLGGGSQSSAPLDLS